MKHVHFIGICGTAMAPIAAMMKDLGWRVTGSDKGIYPPMSDYLRSSGVEFYVGFHPENIGNPDRVVVGNFIGPSNPEFIAIQERGLAYCSYPEVLAEFLIKSESIVVAGTYGKTTNTALLAWIWEQAGLNPSFMSAGILKNFSSGTRNTPGRWSIVEGDEYPASRWNPVPKFSFYRPRYLLLTGVAHDHLDVYPTEEAFIQVFEQLAANVPEDGLIVAAANRPNMERVARKAKARVMRYGRHNTKPIAATCDWSLDILERKEGKTKILIHGPEGSIGPATISLLGDESLDHIAGVAALATHAGISTKKIVHALETFQGVRRRMETRGVIAGVTIIDDLGHSPTKAKATLAATRLSYPTARIIAVYEPNVGSRVISSQALYRGAFDEADTVLIPRLSATKIAEGEEPRMEGSELAETIRKGRKTLQRTPVDVAYEPDDKELISRIKNTVQPGDVVLFLGSHGFRGMIEDTLEVLARSFIKS